MGNVYIKIIAKEIQDGQKNGNARIAWQRIKELKQSKQNTRHGNMVLKDKNGNIQSETHVNLKTMQSYIEEHFARMREDWQISCIAPATWHDKEQLNIQISEKGEFNIKHRNSKVQQYANSEEKEDNRSIIWETVRTNMK